MKALLIVYGLLIISPWTIYPALLALFRKRTRPSALPVSPNKWLILTAGRNTNGRGTDHLLYLERLCTQHGNAHAVYIDDCSEGTESLDLVAFSEMADFANVSVITMHNHAGKEKALEAGTLHSCAELPAPTHVLMLDVGVRLWVGGEPDNVLKNMDRDRYFRLPTVGGVAFSDSVEKLGLYLRLEMMIRHLESRAGGLVGAGGMAMAMRADAMPMIYEPPCDLTMARVAMQKGYWMMHGGNDYQAVYAKPLSGGYQRAVRTAMRGMAGVKFVRGEPWWNFKLFCHKHLRWASSVLITLCPLSWPLFRYLQPHFAITHALVLTLMGKRVTKWKATQR